MLNISSDIPNSSVKKAKRGSVDKFAGFSDVAGEVVPESLRQPVTIGTTKASKRVAVRIRPLRLVYPMCASPCRSLFKGLISIFLKSEYRPGVVVAGFLPDSADVG
jgi:hypothetical protein